MNIACSRCGRVLELAFTDEDGDGVEATDVSVVTGGMVLAVCRDCVTDDEAVEIARRSAAALLDACEEALESFRMVAERVPDVADSADFKAAVAETERRADEARAALRALDTE